MKMQGLWVGITVATFAGLATAELQNVEIGGKIEIHGAAYSKFLEAGDGADRIPPAFLRGRALGPNGTLTYYRSNGGGQSIGFIEQRTRLHVRADFSEGVSAFVEVDSCDFWGEDFRSVNYITGMDGRADSSDDVEIYQAYIGAQDVFGLPLEIRLGRQELEFGSGWLVGADPGPYYFVGLSFDALRLTFTQDNWSLDAWMAKAAENYAGFGSGDIDFYGVYATYALPGQGDDAASPLQVDAYWMLVRDDLPVFNTTLGPVGEWVEDLLNRDQYETTTLHTAGLRLAGTAGAFDYEAEAAYQWGNADAVGFLFAPAGGLYGDDGAHWSSFAGHTEAGYTLDVQYSPRFYVGGAYYDGEDRRDLSLRDWLNPFDTPEASLSFNRLFSSWKEDNFFDITALSNFWKAYLGATAAFPSEAVEIGLSLMYFGMVEPFDQPLGMIVDGRRVPFFSMFPFLTKTGSKDLGWQTLLYAAYQFSDDLSFEAGWSHYFVGDALGDGAFLDENGMTLVDGLGDDDAEFFYFLTTLEF